MNAHNKNNKADVVAAKPVFAPNLTPTLLSANDVTVEVPKGAQIRAPVASAIKTLLYLCILPSSSIISVPRPTAINVAVVSKILTKINEKIAT